MRQIFALGLAGLMTNGAAYAAGDCGTISMAEMNWSSAGLAAWVDKIILEEGYGCEVELVTGDTIPTFTSMNEKGEPDVAPELWVHAIREQLDTAVEEKRLRIAAEILSDGGVEGFYVPTEMARREGIATLADALARPELFPGAEDESKGAIFNCPPGWQCQIVIDNLFRASGAAEKGFELVETGSAAAMDGSVAQAFNREQGWLGYYWSPTALLGRFDMTRLDMGTAHDPAEWERCTIISECADPVVNDWPEAKVLTLVTEDLAQRAPVAMGYFENRAWPSDVVNDVLAWMGENQATNEDGAWRFLETHAETWRAWLPEDVAQRVADAL